MEKRELVSLVEASIPENSQLVAIIRVGSKAYNLDTAGSDDDYRCIYKQSNKDVLCGRYIPNVQVTPDIVAFELREFLRQIHAGSFTATEMLFVHKKDNFIFRYRPIFEDLYKRRYQLIGESLVTSMLGYIKSSMKIKDITPKKEYHIYRLLYVLRLFRISKDLNFTIGNPKTIQNLKGIKLGFHNEENDTFKRGLLEELEVETYSYLFKEAYTKKQIQDLEYEIRVQF